METMLVALPCDTNLLLEYKLFFQTLTGKTIQISIVSTVHMKPSTELAS